MEHSEKEELTADCETEFGFALYARASSSGNHTHCRPKMLRLYRSDHCSTAKHSC